METARTATARGARATALPAAHSWSRLNERRSGLPGRSDGGHLTLDQATRSPERTRDPRRVRRRKLVRQEAAEAPVQSPAPVEDLGHGGAFGARPGLLLAEATDGEQL